MKTIIDSLMNIGRTLSRAEMKQIMAGSGSCGSSCSGCSKDNTSHGDCVEWVCEDDMWCVPKTSNCCIS